MPGAYHSGDASVTGAGSKQHPKTSNVNRRELHDIKDIKFLPEGQLRAVVGLVGSDSVRTHKQASIVAGMSLGTLYTHLGRVRNNYPKLYKAIRRMRRTQLRVRHREAVQRDRDHTKKYFRNVRKRERWMLAGYWGY